MDLQLRVAPEVRLRSHASGLRAVVLERPATAPGGRLAAPAVTPSVPAATAAPAEPGSGGSGSPAAEPVRERVGTGIGSRSGSEGADVAPRTVLELEREALSAIDAGDLYALRSVEEGFASLHLQAFVPRRRPDAPVPPVLPEREREALQRKAFRAGLTPVSIFKRAARQRADALASAEATDFARKAQVGHAVFAQHRAALLDDEWNTLAGHDRATVITELDAEFAAAGNGATCIDAGWAPDSPRGYVTVVARYPVLDIVGERAPGTSVKGRRMLRRRTQSERNAIYLAGLASFALAVARHAITVAVAADDVQLVIVRDRAGGGLEPVYVGNLSREAVTLRPALADPVPLFLSAAVLPMCFDGPPHDIVALASQAEVDEVVRRCVDALDDERLDGLLDAGHA